MRVIWPLTHHIAYPSLNSWSLYWSGSWPSIVGGCCSSSSLYSSESSSPSSSSSLLHTTAASAPAASSPALPASVAALTLLPSLLHKLQGSLISLIQLTHSELLNSVRVQK